MKLKLSIFLIGLFIAALGIGIWVDATTKTPVYFTRQSQLRQIPDTYRSSGAGFGAGLAVFGIGAGIGIPWILKQRSPS